MNTSIVAVITTSPDKVSGGAPIFIVPDAEEQQKVAFLLEKITDSTAHDLKNGVMILFKH